MDMEQVELGRSGVKVSRIGLGLWQAGGPAWGDDVNDEDCIAAMVRAHELGVNLFDTAEAYGDGHSEEVVGRALKEIGRDEIVIATKVSGDHLRRDDVTKACERSLKRLGVDAIDVYQVHWPDPWQQIPLGETMKAMERLHKDGKIRAVGVSNFAVRDLEEARATLSTTDIVSNQVQYNMIHREIEKEVLPYCRREGISIMAWGPLAEGALTGKYGAGNKPQDPIRKGHGFFADASLESIGRLVEVMERLGKAHDKTVPQVALSWLLATEGVIPIPGAKRTAHVESNVGGAGWNLSEKEMAALEAAIEDVRLDRF